MSIVRVYGKGNCEICGRFAYAIDIDPPGCDEVELWDSWCKKHIPDWAKSRLNDEDRDWYAQDTWDKYNDGRDDNE